MYEAEVYLNSRLQSLHYLSIHEWHLEISKGRDSTEQPRSIKWKDVLAVNELKTKTELSKLELVLFIKRKPFLRKIRRVEQSLYLYMNPEATETFMKKIREFITHSQVEKPRLLLYHNPIAGSNSGRHLETCLEFLARTHFRWEIIRTERRGHCLESMKALQNPQDYWGVVIISGDGLMHECVNALQDIPICHIPAGSGNAFSATQAQEAGENCSVKQNLYLAIKGQRKKFSLGKFTLETHPQPIYSCLSLEWAFIADIDMGSEFMRFLGGLRFQVYSVWRWLFLRRYLGRLSYTQTEAPMPPLDQPINDDRFTIAEKQYHNALFCSIPFISDKYNVAPLLNISEGKIDMQCCEASAGRWKFLKYLLSFQTGGQFDSKTQTVRQGFKVLYKHVRSYRLEPIGEDKGVFGIDGERYDAQRIQCEVVRDRLEMFTFLERG